MDLATEALVRLIATLENWVTVTDENWHHLSKSGERHDKEQANATQGSLRAYRHSMDLAKAALATVREQEVRTATLVTVKAPDCPFQGSTQRCWDCDPIPAPAEWS